WTHSGGWRMRANKNGRSGQPAHGLADLKRLRKAAAQAAATPDTAPPAGTKATKTAKAVEPALSRDDALLFRRAMKTVQPIKAARRTLLPVQRPVAAGDILRQRRERATGLDPVRLPQ